MNPESTFRRVVQSATGAAFVLLGALVATGFGGFAAYSLKVRSIVAGLIVLYGVIRLRGAWAGRPDHGENELD